ncbi:protein of unknown function (plasmid) [Streptantibioticus cattleyicolor NRRL 8057 = DSM 46488]|nr:protein of unknown function [Streptantibioticus cattleyicolor NRRL 8057 = DSM 46488]
MAVAAARDTVHRVRRVAVLRIGDGVGPPGGPSRPPGCCREESGPRRCPAGPPGSRRASRPRTNRTAQVMPGRAPVEWPAAKAGTRAVAPAVRAMVCPVVAAALVHQERPPLRTAVPPLIALAVAPCFPVLMKTSPFTTCGRVSGAGPWSYPVGGAD